MALLETHALTRRFGGLPALDGVDLAIDAGHAVAVIGPNGAGKSTLLRVLTGELAPSAGTVVLDGDELTGRPPHQVRHRGIASVGQTPRVFPSLSTRDNVAIGAMFGGGRRVPEGVAVRRADALLDLLGLGPARAKPVGALTLHERRTVELARALAGRPRVLLLDEVMAGLTPEELTASLSAIRQLRDGMGMTVVFVEHIMRAVSALADRVVVLHFGRVLAVGATARVMADPAVIAAYVGRRTGRDADG